MKNWFRSHPQLVALCVIFLPLIFFLLLGIFFWSNIYLSRQDDLQEKQNLLARYQNLVAQDQALRSSLQDFEQQKQQASYLFVASNPTLGVGKLQEKLAFLVQEAGCSLQTTKNNYNVSKDDLIVLSSSLQVSCDIMGVSSLMTAIENYRPLLKINAFHLISLQNPQMGKIGTITEGALQITLEISGFQEKER